MTGHQIPNTGLETATDTVTTVTKMVRLVTRSFQSSRQIGEWPRDIRMYQIATKTCELATKFLFLVAYTSFLIPSPAI